MRRTCLVVAFVLAVYMAKGLENGLVRKPPMGWMSWLKFLCEVNCDNNPHSCIHENLYKSMADHLVEGGYRDAGYEHVHIDDCWMAMTRDENGRLIANSTRFPSGIPALADYMHSRGLKLGIYEDYGTQTCMGYPGSIDYLKEDAKTFAEWRVDYLKLDGCNSNETQMAKGYPLMQKFLNATGRSIVYSCSWPAYLGNRPDLIDYDVIGKYCNLWRNYNDIEASWDSVINIIQHYNDDQDTLIAAHGPGRWNDPDMIVVGNLELTVSQSIVQMTVWCIWSAPLIMSSDLRTITPEYAEILLNRDAIAIDQDPLGRMGRMISKDEQSFVYVKEITPIDTAKHLYSYAFAVVNYVNSTITFETDLASLGLTNPDGYDLFDVWKGCWLGRRQTADRFEAKIEGTGAIFIRATLPGLSEGPQEPHCRMAPKHKYQPGLMHTLKKINNRNDII